MQQIRRLAYVVREALSDHRWIFVAALWIAAGLLSCWGVKLQFAATGEARSFLDPLYRTIQLIMLDDGMVVTSGGALPWQLEVSRFLLPALAAGTALLALIAFSRPEVDSIRRKFMRGHVVICGLGRKGMLLAQGFRSQQRSVVAIDINESESLEEFCREHGVLLLRGDATEADTLSRARVQRAAQVVALCGNDGANAEIAVRCWELMREIPRRILSAYCHIVNPTLCRLLRERELMSEFSDNYRLAFFNVFDSTARLALEKHATWLDNATGRSMVVVGVGRMGENLIAHAGRRWWPVFRRTGERLHITVVDTQAPAKVENLRISYPRLPECCVLETVQADVNGPEFLSAAFLDPSRPGYHVPSTVFVCLDSDSVGLSAALRLLHAYRDLNVPIVVRMEHDSGLASLLLGRDARSGSAFSSLHPFGMLDNACTPENLFNDTRDLLAREIHRSYVTERTRVGETMQTNEAIRPWNELPASLRESNMQQADQIGVKLHAIGCGIVPLSDWAAEPLQFSREEIERLSIMEHRRFVAERLADGWKYTAGPKNVDAKVSPTLVDWEELSEVEREKDRSAVSRIPELLATAGFEVYRLGLRGNDAGPGMSAATVI